MHQGPLDDHNEIASLSEITMGSKFSGFGVILDSTRAIRVNSRQAVEYNTQIKIIDKSMNPSLVTGQSSKGYVTFFMYWSSEDNQPFPHKIGDIIRFNHFEPEQFRGYLQGKNKKGSSWCIYHGDSANNEPYCFSTDFKDKMTQYHVQKLHEYRQWGTSFFQQHSLRNLDWYSYERHVENPSVQTFDMLLRVEEIRLPSDESTGLFLILVDNKMQKFQTHVNAIHAKFLKEGEIVKLRSIESIDGGKYLKGNQKYFAVLGIPDHYRDAQEFTESITIQESQIERMEEEGGEDLNQVPGQYTNFDPAFFTNRGVLLQSGSRLSSAVSSRRKDLPKKTAFETLKELESQEPDRIIKENHKFHMRLTLIDIRPKSLSEALRYECRICRQIRRLDAPEGQVCCSRPMEKTMLLRLLWQDQSLKTSKKLLVTYVAPGDENNVKCLFPELPLKEIVAGELEKYEKTWEDIVERYLEDDRLFDILVEPFDNILLKESDLQLPLRLTETLFVPVLQ